MKSINYSRIPIDSSEDFNQKKSTWSNGKYIKLDLGKSIQVFVGHKKEVMVDENNEEKEIMTAFSFIVDKPLTRDKAINAAEMEAYGLSSALEVASLNASLSRKFRENFNDQEVVDHDEFINWIKEQLNLIGIIKKSTNSTNDIVSTNDLLSLSKMIANNTTLNDSESIKIKNIYPIWGDESGSAKFGTKVSSGFKLRVIEGGVNDLFEVIQQHTLQSNWKPGQGTESLYRRIPEENQGSKDDPIVWPQDGNMIVKVGLYYKEGDDLYIGIENSIIPLYSSLALNSRYVRVVEE